MTDNLDLLRKRLGEDSVARAVVLFLEGKDPSSWSGDFARFVNSMVHMEKLSLADRPASGADS